MTLQNYIRTITDPRRQRLLRRALQMGVKVELVSPEWRIVELSYRGKKRLLLDDHHGIISRPGLTFTSNKQISKLLLERAGLRVAPGLVAPTVQAVIRAVQSGAIQFPLVVKPVDGRKGLAVTVGVTNLAELRLACRKVQQYWERIAPEARREFLVEAVQTGRDFRILVLNGKVIACAERIPAAISGNGRSTVRQVVATFNKRRPAHYQLKLDEEVRQALARAGYGLDSVMPKDETIQVRRNANISGGGRAVDRTHEISPRFRQIAVQAAAALQLEFTGVDLFVDDIGSNNPRQPYCLIEVNSGPEYDLNEKPVVEGPGVDVTERLIRYLLAIRD